MQIGIYGGTFDPIHKGHLALAKAFLDSGEMDEIWFIVSPQNPFKRNKQLLDDDARLRMVRAAVENEPDMKASDYEFHLPKPSYMWNTLCHIREDFPNDKFILLIGGDNWERFSDWYHSADIVASHRIIIYPRAGCHIDESALPESVKLFHTPLIEVSSTDIRERAKRGEDISSMVPKSVGDIIRRNGYYK